MQFIEKRDGRRHNYWPDSHPMSYSDCCDIIAVFKVKPKLNTYQWKVYVAKSRFLGRWNWRYNKIEKIKKFFGLKTTIYDDTIKRNA